MPGFPSYSLGNLCHSLGIVMENRHRAGGDAEATVKVFKILLERDTTQFIQKSLQRNSKEFILPPNVPKEHFDQLPYTPGVYYFHNEKGKVIYVGKALNVKYRVNSHFSNNSQSRQKQNFLRSTYAITHQPCGTELMASILESTEIRKLWPAFNYSQKWQEQVYGIYAYEDRNGYMRLAIEKNRKHIQPVCTFHRLVEGHDILRRLIRDFELCPKLCFLQKGNIKCEGVNEGYCHGPCESRESQDAYNYRVLEAMESLKSRPSFAIIDKGLAAGELSCVLMLNGEFYGMGYLPDDLQVHDVDTLAGFLTRYPDNSFVRNLVLKYAEKFPEKIRSFDGEYNLAPR
jgi:DNA polymerase-3 subunit epsilon